MHSVSEGLLEFTLSELVVLRESDLVNSDGQVVTGILPVIWVEVVRLAHSLRLLDAYFGNSCFTRVYIVVHLSRPLIGEYTLSEHIDWLVERVVAVTSLAVLQGLVHVASPDIIFLVHALRL